MTAVWDRERQVLTDGVPPSGDAAVACVGLRKVFGDRRAVDGVGFVIRPGETYGLLGPNGAGKTTTVAMLVGLLRRDGGWVRIAGHDLDADPGAAKAAVGFVPQEIALYPDLTARENLRFFGRLYGLRGRALAARIGVVLELVGLAERADESVETYSGGMRRRVNIAAGLVHEPAVLVLDEPTVGVDPQSRNAIMEGIEALRRDGLTVLYISHYMEEVQRLCDRVGIIDRGRLIAEGTPRELIERLGRADHVLLSTDADPAVLAARVRHLAGVQETLVEDGRVRVVAHAGRRLLPELLAAASGDGGHVTSAEVVEPDLEAVFLHLTGNKLRD